VTTACAFGPNVSKTREGTLFGLSRRRSTRRSITRTEVQRTRLVQLSRALCRRQFGARATCSKAITRINIDASVRYKITDFEVSVEGVNLTDD
jgi:iron complex outermembrane receptor protein